MQNSSTRLHLPSLLQFASTGLALIVTLPGAVILAVLGLVIRLSGRGNLGQSTSLFALASIALFVSILLLPSAGLSLFRLLGRQPPAWRLAQPYRLATYLLVLWPVVVGVGELSTRLPDIAWLVLPFMQILAIGIPIWWLIETGRRGLSPGSSDQRTWGVLGFGLVGTPLVAGVLEVLVILVLLMLGLLYLVTQPAMLDQLRQLSNQLNSIGQDPEQMLNLFKPYLQQPGIVLSGIVVIAVLMPMVEELVKPMLLWFLAPGSKMTPSDGFVAGLIYSGAFGLMESLNVASNISDSSWASVVAVRMGTGMLHTVTTGLMGWALVSALTQSRYLRLGVTYLLSVTLHGLWNLFGVLFGINEILPSASGFTGVASRLGLVAPAALVLLAVVLFAILVGANRRLRPAPAPILETIDAPRGDTPFEGTNPAEESNSDQGEKGI